MRKKSIILYLCDYFDESLIQSIVKDIELEFHYPVFVKKYDIDLTKFYFPGRRQYDANRLLEVVSKINTSKSIKKIALFKVDIFIPILTFIFGQAILNGNTGIVSLYRLRNELYGLSPNNDILKERLKKVIIHEIGHMFGLIHCQNPICVMNSSTYVEHLDQKRQNICQKCSAEIDNDNE